MNRSVSSYITTGCCCRMRCIPPSTLSSAPCVSTFTNTTVSVRKSRSNGSTSADSVLRDSRCITNMCFSASRPIPTLCWKRLDESSARFRTESSSFLPAHACTIVMLSAETLRNMCSRSVYALDKHSIANTRRRASTAIMLCLPLLAPTSITTPGRSHTSWRAYAMALSSSLSWGRRALDIPDATAKTRARRQDIAQRKKFARGPSRHRPA